MADLSSSYLGLTLRNPVVVSSSNLTSSVDKVVACEQAGAGAVVLKSLFEEQIVADTQQMMEQTEYLAHSEARDFFSGMGKNYYMDEYLKLVRHAKEQVSIPVIASLNCVSDGTWLDYAKSLQEAGADALELNVFIIPANIMQSGREIEEIYLRIGRKIKKRIGLPVAMKIGSHFSGLAHTIKALADDGMDGFVLFNRFYRPDVDIEKLAIVPAEIFSSRTEISLSLQWIALLSGEIGCEATTGVHEAADVIKQLLVGAAVAQTCTALYKQGVEHIGAILEGMREWMKRHGFEGIGEFQGRLSQERSEHPEAYERSQYVKALVGIA
jgi:dihydroorotate dehydrogenase (fumarate)